MIYFLEEYLKEDLVGAYVHGSLGTHEEIAYSDFDSLAILKNDLFGSADRLANAASLLNRACSIMFDFDPLQHHGWFILAESDLADYDNSYFPIELFPYAKSLFADRGLELNINVNDKCSQFRQGFHKLAFSLYGKLNSQYRPNNMYQLKNLLSAFMLLPAKYIQARDGIAVYKKRSFAMARDDFDSGAWAIIHRVSDLRESWFYRISMKKRRMCSQPAVWRSHFMTRFGPRIPREIRSGLTASFYSEMTKLIELMMARLK